MVEQSSSGEQTMRRSILFAMALAMVQSMTGGASADRAPAAFDRSAFYTQDQGSRLIPLKWMMALKQPGSSQPFMADNLSRYGYLKNDATPGATLPVGFTTNRDGQGNEYLGMTCAACHTREIQVNGAPIRIDGGPAIVVFQSLMADLDISVGGLLKDQPGFDAFAASVLGGTPTPAQMTALKADVQAWFTPYHTIVQCALPQQTDPTVKCADPSAAQAWGPSRLDAVAMIFDRVAGLDIGKPPNHIIQANIGRANAPTRYPFLWNAGRQNKTQWPGFAPNGTPTTAVIRNVGEVLGVFGRFYPTQEISGFASYKDNSVNMDGLLKLETLIDSLTPPAFRWPVDKVLAQKGAEIYKWSVDQGSGCESCHGVQLVDPMLPASLWKTPILNVGTDTAEWQVLGRSVNTGVLAGSRMPLFTAPLANPALASSALGNAVLGIMSDHIGEIAIYDLDHSTLGTGSNSVLTKTVDIGTEIASSLRQPKTPPGSYESRVMHGIWAAAPYLHNGSVPTLADLLKPAQDRPTSFKIGPNYDPTGDVGLAKDQTKFDFTLQTGCVASTDPKAKALYGNTNCGHEFGTNLTADQKRALLEYLKTL